MSGPYGIGFGPNLDGQVDAAIDLQRHVYARTEATLARWRERDDALTDADAVRRRQAEIRAAVVAGVGGLPQGNPPLEPETVGEIRADGFVIRKLVFSAFPKVYITANLYLPATGSGGPTGAVILVCGHAEAGKAYPPYQAVCARLARNGLVALAIDPFGQGERLGYPATDEHEPIAWGTTEHSHAGLQCWWIGQSPARYFLHEISAAVDLLAGLPEVDPGRIGITGNSGGGTMTALATVVEPRLAAAAPATFISGRGEYLWSGQAQDAEQILLGGTAAGVDHADLLLAAAPRPVLVLAADHDFFPLQGTLASVERAQRGYRLLGAAGELRLVRCRDGHEYHPELAIAATEFFASRLGSASGPGPYDHREPDPLDPADLRCSRSGQIALDRPETRRIFDLNLAEYRALPTDRSPADIRAWLAEQVWRDRRPEPELYARWQPERLGPADVRVRRVIWRPETDIWNAGVLLRRGDAPVRTVRIVLLDDGTTAADAAIGELDGSDTAVLVVDVRGVGALAPRPVNGRPVGAVHGTMYKLVTDLLWLGDSLTAARSFDVLRAVDLALGDPEVGLVAGGRVELHATGRSALWGAIAAALDDRIDAFEPAGLPDLAGALPDLAALLEERYYDSEADGWQSVLPGLAAHVLPE